MWRAFVLFDVQLDKIIYSEIIIFSDKMYAEL